MTDDDTVSLDQMRDEELEVGEAPTPKKQARWRKAAYTSERSAACDPPPWQRDRALLPKKPPTRSGRPWEPDR